MCNYWFPFEIPTQYKSPSLVYFPMSSNSSGSSTPFEWLSGGLFFAKKDVKPSAVDTCRDVNVLLDGVRDGMNQLFHMEEGALEKEDIPSDDAKTQQREEVEGLVSAKLRRLRFLLYEERRQSSQTESARKPAVASRMSELLTTERIDPLGRHSDSLHCVSQVTKLACMGNFFPVCAP